ncbi:hypothetical protein [Scytonema sp. NUACC26]
MLKKVTYCASMVLVYKGLAIKNWELGTKSVASLPISKKHAVSPIAGGF